MQLAAALLLVGAGVAKLLAPDQAATMLRTVWRTRLPLGRARLLVRVSGVGEMAVGAAVLGTGNRVADASLGCCYLAFLIVAWRLVRRGQRAPCGCFGATDSPVGVGHLVVNTAAFAIAIGGVIRPPGPAGGVFDGDLLTGTVALGQAVLLAYLAFLSITALPALVAARRRLLEAP